LRNFTDAVFRGAFPLDQCTIHRRNGKTACRRCVAHKRKDRTQIQIRSTWLSESCPSSSVVSVAYANFDETWHLRCNSGGRQCPVSSQFGARTYRPLAEPGLSPPAASGKPNRLTASGIGNLLFDRRRSTRTRHWRTAAMGEPIGRARLLGGVLGCFPGDALSSNFDCAACRSRNLHHWPLGANAYWPCALVQCTIA